MRLYADDNCILFRSKSVSLIEKHLNDDFDSLCEWFIDNKLPIHLREDKTNCILFKGGNKHYPSLSISKNENKIKQNSLVEYLECLVDEDFSEEFMAKRALEIINWKTKFLLRQSRYVSCPLKRMLCSSLMQPNCDSTSCAWYPNLMMSLKNKLQQFGTPV